MPPLRHADQDSFVLGPVISPLLADEAASSEGYIESLSLSENQPRRKAVRFNKSSRVMLIESREELSDDERANFWYETSTLMESVRNDIARAKQAKAEESAGLAVDKSGMCTRGIEDFLTASGIDERSRRRMVVLSAVMSEQERHQRQHHTLITAKVELDEAILNDDEITDNAVRRAAAIILNESSLKAARRGAADAAVVESLHRMDQRRLQNWSCDSSRVRATKKGRRLTPVLFGVRATAA